MSTTDPLKELEDALSFPTSPDFCARIRRQVAMAPVRSRFTATTKALAVAAAVILAAASSFTVVQRSRDSEMAELDRPVIANVTQAPVNSEGAAVVARARVFAPARSTRLIATGAETTFETLVPDDQLRALDRLLAAMGQGRASVPPAAVVDELNDDGQRVLRALVIELMKVEPLAGTPGEAGKNPVKDPIK